MFYGSVNIIAQLSSRVRFLNDNNSVVGVVLPGFKVKNELGIDYKFLQFLILCMLIYVILGKTCC